MRTIRLLILSDMHVIQDDVKRKSRLSNDLSELPYVSNPVEALKVFFKDNSLDVDFLLNLGDVTDMADRVCWWYGIRLLREIKNSLGIKEIIHTTGNHDVIIDEGDNFYLPKHTIDYPVADEEVSNEYWSKGYCFYKTPDILFFILNTETYLHSKSDLSMPPKLDEDKIKQIESDLSKYSDYQGFKLAMMHHHIIQHSDNYNNITSNDVIEMGDRLLSVLKTNGFRLVVHGHKHLARLKVEDDIAVFASGSFSSLENIKMCNGDNCFHIIHIDIGEETNGFIETYKYDIMRGWVPVSDPKAHFAFHVGIGISMDINQLGQSIIDKYHNLLENKHHVERNEYLTDFPCIMYLSTQQKEVLDMLLKKHNYQFIGEQQVLMKLLS